MGLRSNSSSSKKQAPVHLQKVYEARKQRTFELVKQSIDKLVSQEQKVSLTTVVAQSKELDPKGKGVSISAIQRNEQANAYYKNHQSYKNLATKRSSIIVKKLSEREAPRIKLDRDLARVRQRYLKVSKEELVDHILVVEQALAQKEQDLNTANDKILSWRLKAGGFEIDDFAESLEVENLELKKQNQLTMKLLTQTRVELEALKEKDSTNFGGIPY